MNNIHSSNCCQAYTIFFAIVLKYKRYLGEIRKCDKVEAPRFRPRLKYRLYFKTVWNDISLYALIWTSYVRQILVHICSCNPDALTESMKKYDVSKYMSVKKLLYLDIDRIWLGFWLPFIRSWLQDKSLSNIIRKPYFSITFLLSLSFSVSLTQNLLHCENWKKFIIINIIIIQKVMLFNYVIYEHGKEKYW